MKFGEGTLQGVVDQSLQQMKGRCGRAYSVMAYEPMPYLYADRIENILSLDERDKIKAVELKKPICVPNFRPQQVRLSRDTAFTSSMSSAPPSAPAPFSWPPSQYWYAYTFNTVNQEQQPSSLIYA